MFFIAQQFGYSSQELLMPCRQISECYSELGQFGMARSFLDRAIKLIVNDTNPQFAPTCEQYAIVLRKSGEWERVNCLFHASVCLFLFAFWRSEGVQTISTCACLRARGEKKLRKSSSRKRTLLFFWFCVLCVKKHEKQSLEYSRKALKAAKGLLGEKHIQVAHILLGKACAELEIRQPFIAEQSARSALSIVESEENSIGSNLGTIFDSHGNQQISAGVATVPKDQLRSNIGHKLFPLLSPSFSGSLSLSLSLASGIWERKAGESALKRSCLLWLFRSENVPTEATFCLKI